MNNKILLYPHNELAYQKLNESLKHHQLVSIDHATGTGKSFIILKYLYENRHKKILYLSPTYPIIDQLINEHMPDLGINKGEFRQFDTNIYRNFLKMDMNALAREYDIIVVDEYHKCGAKKCVKKIMQLKEITLKNYPNNVIIGMTATPIRYLDDKKDMNQIIFDGHIASKLSLADAILQGILPIFEYVVSSYPILVELEQIKAKIKKYLIYGSLDRDTLEKLKNLEFLVENLIVGEKKLDEYLPECGKYLVFDSSVRKLRSDRKLIRKIFKRKKYKEYIINYQHKRDENLEILSNFRKASKLQNPVLFSINILNEGVHVKDVDCIFMLRYTTSPIIFFQELGRLLSYSRRKDKVTVFDLQNNIGRNPAIYELFTEVRTRAKELLITDPERKERYERILENFKIIDNAEIFKLLEDLKQITSIDNLLNHRLNNAIKVLQSSDLNAYSVQAYIDLFHYQKYITLDQFRLIKSLPIEKPSICNFSEEEFIKILNGFKNLKEKESDRCNNSYKMVLEFYKDNYCMPSIFSDDKYEVNIACNCLNEFHLYSDSKKKSIQNICDDSLSTIEKLSYYLIFDIDDLEELYEQIDLFLDKKIVINNNIIAILEESNTETSKIFLEQINKFGCTLCQELFEEDDYIDKEQDNKVLRESFDVDSELLFRKDFSREATILFEEYDKSENKKDYIDNVYKDIIKFIDENYRLPQYVESEKKLFYKKIIFSSKLHEYNYIEKINNYLEQKQKEHFKSKKNTLKEDIISFMEKHSGGMPVLGDNEFENNLFNRYLEMSAYFDEIDLSEIVLKRSQFKSQRKKIVMNYIRFINLNNRRPNQYSEDEEERKIFYSFIRIRDYLDDQEMNLVKKCESKLNKYKETKQLYLDMISKKRGNFK